MPFGWLQSPEVLTGTSPDTPHQQEVIGEEQESVVPTLSLMTLTGMRSNTGKQHQEWPVDWNKTKKEPHAYQGIVQWYQTQYGRPPTPLPTTSILQLALPTLCSENWPLLSVSPTPRPDQPESSIPTTTTMGSRHSSTMTAHYHMGQTPSLKLMISPSREMGYCQTSDQSGVMTNILTPLGTSKESSMGQLLPFSSIPGSTETSAGIAEQWHHQQKKKRSSPTGSLLLDLDLTTLSQVLSPDLSALETFSQQGSSLCEGTTDKRAEKDNEAEEEDQGGQAVDPILEWRSIISMIMC
ncbi:uncharacterized protein BT62DRAFT_915703 [Guyanagaster necrorhizus]|uniref:Uncharacterized protein n=1 Tax=Guyanagaster necrorhizus TaxID=856835 RepID=A0A9P8AY61_9AGAR|nr:uncharacterized protein BT62DRAFT_915703 [Guyanagaster necrorhizus MCA 3950]KAG7451911.1 hypothetical protein BT62DRAFT_915703 [Guyanagaster necrorhizus MCA 3950]